MSANISLVPDLTDGSYVYSNTEKVIISCYLALVVGFSTFLNSSIIYFAIKYSQFHKPCMLIRASQALVNLFAIWSMSVGIILNIFFKELPVLLRCTWSALTLGFYITSLLLVNAIAIERYYFFCKPFKYLQVFSFKTIFIVTFIFIIIPQILCCSHLLESSRIGWRPIVYLCLFKYDAKTVGQVSPTRYIVFIPTLSVIALTIYKINKLRAQLNQETAERELGLGIPSTEMDKKDRRKAIRYVF